MLHHFTRSIAHIALPDKFTYPFHYTPHPLCVMALMKYKSIYSIRLNGKMNCSKAKCSAY